MTVYSESELELNAKERLGEDKTTVKRDLHTLKDWIRKSPHLQNIRQGVNAMFDPFVFIFMLCLDDSHLLMFLRGCKFSIERTKEKLDLFYACKSSLGHWFQDWNIDSPLFQKMLNCG